METLNEKKLLSHRNTGKRQKERKDQRRFSTRGQRGRRQAPPQGTRNRRRRKPSSEKEIDFWQVRTRAQTTDIVAYVLSPTAADARCTSSHKLVNVLRFSDLLVKKLTTYGVTLFLCLSLFTVTFSLPLHPSLPRACEHSRLNPAGICLPNLAESILTPSRTEIVSSHKSTRG